MTELLQFPDPEPIAPPGDISDQPPDHAARRRALDTRLSAIVEAPAGSGKTGLLLQRYLKLLGEGGVSQPEEVLAITFTRKATAELRERVLEQLHAAAAGRPLPEEAGSFERETRALAESALRADLRHEWRLLDQPQRLRIRTIDALCAEIARTLPLLSGSGTSEPVESAEPLHREAARRTLLELGGSDAALNDALETVLLHRDGNLTDCETLLARMLEHRQQWGDLVPLTAESLSDEHLDTQVRPRLERSLEAIVCTGLQRALDAMPSDVLADLCELVARLGSEPSYHPAEPSPIAVWASHMEPLRASARDLVYWQSLLKLLFTGEGEWRKSVRPHHLRFNVSYEDGDALSGFIERLQAAECKDALKAIRSLPAPKFPDDQWRVAKALFRLLRHALIHLKILFAETGHCDFSELALAACEALAAEDGAADLAHSPVARLTHLLVDEMQDTSSSQYTLLERLTRSWDGHSQTVFLVGDPKQSIYLFRQARVERFLRTFSERRLGDLPLEPLRLTANFRSQAALVKSFNETFAQIFPQSAITQACGQEREVPFVQAHPVRDAVTYPKSIDWHVEILGDQEAPNVPKRSMRDLRAARIEGEAREIRQIIEEWRKRPLPAGRTKPWSIAVLARARRHLTSITSELARDHGNGPIPFRAVDIDVLNERQEVLDALALTRALLHPADRVAWLAVLRAPWCGLSLADLLRLTAEGASSDPDATVAELVAGRATELSPSGQQLLSRVWPILEEAATTIGRTSFSSHLERTWLSLGGDAALAAERLSNVRRFFEVLRALEREGTGYIDSATLNARLSRLFAETAPNDSAVQLLTIHNSKGLEFDVVLIPGLERATPRSRHEILNWLEIDSVDGEAAHILLAPIQSRGEQSDGLNQWLSRAKHARESAETRRLLYVACTRAREVLHLFAAGETDSHGVLRKPTDGSLLRAAWPVASSEFAVDARVVEPEVSPTAAPALRGKLLPFVPASDSEGGLTLAAAADGVIGKTDVPMVHRLPLDFAPMDRFLHGGGLRLPYTPAVNLPHEPTFERPEGSFAVRAFGNVVHRFLQLLASRIADGHTADEVLAELPAWEPRLNAALRNDGLAPTLAQREVPRARTALHNALTDPIGRWILSASDGASSERSIAMPDSTVLRADRTFIAGAAPLLDGGHIWIIDFKTSEQGSRTEDRFEEEELLKYRTQLDRYANALRELSGSSGEIKLGLYYPLVPQLLHWST